MQTVTQLVEVSTAETRGGNTRYIARDSDGREYTTFREEIGAQARRLQGHLVRISHHEVQRGQYTNVYLDEIESVGPPPGIGQAGSGQAGSGQAGSGQAGSGQAGSGQAGSGQAGSGDTDPEEAAWRTAVEAAPWLVGAPGGQVDPDELYEKLKPFEERVAEDIEASRRSEQ